eukprot:JP438674.1.p1 GENE.JP438674.1~~JP438674.1.p1  ORF type:complete len:100 (-),score=6.34 JP438674.1:16-315(-)
MSFHDGVLDDIDISSEEQNISQNWLVVWFEISCICVLPGIVKITGLKHTLTPRWQLLYRRKLCIVSKKNIQNLICCLDLIISFCLLSGIVMNNRVQNTL